LTVVVNNGIVVTLIVLNVSQLPVVLNTVSINVPGAVNTCPRIVVGNAFSQTATLTVEVSNGVVVTLIVLKVSQLPVVLATVSISEPGPLNTWPNMVAGYPFAHTVTLTVVVNNGIVVTLIVLNVSQLPVVLVTVSVNVPGAANKCPRIVVGNAFSHTAILTVEESNGTVVTLIVLNVSQLLVVLATVSMREPGAVNT